YDMARYYGMTWFWNCRGKHRDKVYRAHFTNSERNSKSLSVRRRMGAHSVAKLPVPCFPQVADPDGRGPAAPAAGRFPLVIRLASCRFLERDATLSPICQVGYVATTADGSPEFNRCILGLVAAFVVNPVSEMVLCEFCDI
ncbi:MAG TPA: hypothetical protein VK579_14050, partial [Terriglobales bacterium]|nr:hypothetical protein [Terriglobales bacterium]